MNKVVTFRKRMFPLKTGTPGVILELKAAKAEEKKAYITELSRQGVQEVWKYGIAFCGKKVWLERC